MNFYIKNILIDWLQRLKTLFHQYKSYVFIIDLMYMDTIESILIRYSQILHILERILMLLENVWDFAHRKKYADTNFASREFYNVIKGSEVLL